MPTSYLPSEPVTLGADIERNLLATDGIDADLPAEEHLRIAKANLKDAAVLKKELPLLRQGCFEGRDVEANRIDIGVSKIGIKRKIGDQIAADAILEVETPSMEYARSILSVRANARRPSKV